MKRLFKLSILTVISIIAITLLPSCSIIVEEKVNVIAPSGTPSLALTSFIKTTESADVEIVSGSDPLIAAFTSSSSDIIVAPVNLGAKFYKEMGQYILFKTFVWGNLYIASKNEINGLSDLQDKKLTVFGKNSTPDIVVKTILSSNPSLNVSIEYVSDVTEANTLLLSGAAEYVVSAEPALSKLVLTKNIHYIDLQAEWSKATNQMSYPQAGIFVNKDKLNNTTIQNVLNEMLDSVEYTINNPSDAAEIATSVHTSFETLGASVLTHSIPNCHFALIDNEKTAVVAYLQIMLDLGLGKQMGGSLPDEQFFYSK